MFGKKKQPQQEPETTEEKIAPKGQSSLLDQFNSEYGSISMPDPQSTVLFAIWSELRKNNLLLEEMLKQG